MDRKRHTSKTESAEESAKRQEWILRLQRIPLSCDADPGQLERFQAALEIFGEEDKARQETEKRLREARDRLGSERRGSRHGMEHVGRYIPKHLMPTGDAWEEPSKTQPDEDVPPPPEVP